MHAACSCVMSTINHTFVFGVVNWGQANTALGGHSKTIKKGPKISSSFGFLLMSPLLAGNQGSIDAEYREGQAKHILFPVNIYPSSQISEK